MNYADPQMLFTDPRMRSPSALGAYGDALTDYQSSPIFPVVGLAIDAGLGYAAWYLWHREHQVWAGVLGVVAASGVAWNLYRLVSGAPRPNP